MKKLLAMLLVLAALVGCLVVSASAASNKTGYCEKCKTTVTWEPIVWGTVAAGTHKHYYVPADNSNISQFILKAGANACIDLNGKQLVQPKGRAFLVYGATADAPASLSIQDSVGGATVTSHNYKYLNADGTVSSSTNNGAGGVMWVDNYCTLDIYGGTYGIKVLSSPQSMTTTGGIIAIYNSDSTHRHTYLRYPWRYGRYSGQLRHECLRRYHQEGDCVYRCWCQHPQP